MSVPDANRPDPPAVTPTAATAPAPDHLSSSTVRTVIGLVANVTVITALLVYFGWRRSETQAQRLGIDESILGMSTRDYVIRSVGPVLVLLVGIAVVGLTWLWLERPLRRWLSAHDGSRRGRAARAGLLLAWVGLPLIVIGIGYLWRPGAFVLFPASIGAGVLLALYASRSRAVALGDSRFNQGARLGLVGLLVAVCLFWTASNYAEVLGSSLAGTFKGDLERVTGVVTYSERRLHLDAPGVAETRLPEDEAEEAPYRYRYDGLRLLEHTGGTYFLVSNGWSGEYGVVVALADDDDTVRLEFVRDRR